MCSVEIACMASNDASDMLGFRAPYLMTKSTCSCSPIHPAHLHPGAAAECGCWCVNKVLAIWMISVLLLLFFFVLHKILGTLCFIDDFLAFLNAEESSLTYQGVVCRLKNQEARRELKSWRFSLYTLWFLSQPFPCRGAHEAEIWHSHKWILLSVKKI